MARPSARTAMLDAALRVIENNGIAALTLDAVAAEAGVTKRGLIYHFPSKHALITAIHVLLADRMDATLREALGKDPVEATEEERTVAYVRTSADAASRVDLRLIAEAHAEDEPEWTAPWEALAETWFPEESLLDEEPDERRVRNLVARMAADGLWGYELAPGTALGPAVRDRVVERILALLDEPA